MAGTRAQQFQMLSDAAVLQQFAGCLLAASFNVLNEADTTQNHANRLKFAQAVFDAPEIQARNFVANLIKNPTLNAQAGGAPGPSGTPFADSDVDFVVAEMYDGFANKFAGA